MVESLNTSEKKKQMGNDAFKKGEYTSAIKFYTEAINIQEHEAIYSNRAACHLKLNNWSQAMEDCKQAIRLNPDFGKTYKRLFNAHLALGHIDEAEQALKMALEKEPDNPLNKDDQNKMDKAKHQHEKIQHYGQVEQKFDKAVDYCNGILETCTDSVEHISLKMEYLLKSLNLKTATEFAKETSRRPGISQNAKVKAWTGRVFLYSGNEPMGKQLLMQALQSDPDNVDAQRAIKNIKKAAELKERAGAHFKNEELKEANELFDQCLQVDHLNLSYNSIIYLNKSITLDKLKQKEEALSCLNKSIQMNPQYAKALVKRGEVKTALGDHDEAVLDFVAASEIDSNGHGVQQKLKAAQQKAKQAKKSKDYYETLGVKKDATEAEIKKAYKKLAAKWHPDRHGETEEGRLKAEKKFKEISEANRVLGDKQKRQQYDMGANPEDDSSGMGGFSGFNMGGMPGGMPGGMGGGIDPSQIFQMFMGQHGGSPGMSQGMPGGAQGMDDIFSMFGGMPGGAQAGRGRGSGQQRAGFSGFPGFQQTNSRGGRGGAGPTFSFNM